MLIAHCSPAAPAAPAAPAEWAGRPGVDLHLRRKLDVRRRAARPLLRRKVAGLPSALPAERGAGAAKGLLHAAWVGAKRDALPRAETDAVLAAASAVAAASAPGE